MTPTPLLPLDQAHNAARVGGKAAALARLLRQGLPVPEGLVVPVGTPESAVPILVDRILAWAEGRAPYGLIARSSAVAEDGAAVSFAGMYASRFTPAHSGPLHAAITEVRSSALQPTAQAYARAHGITAALGMAVVIQPALRPTASGVLAAEVLAGRCVRWRIEAVRGLAEPLVSGTQTGEVHSGLRHTAHPVQPAEQRIILMPGAPDELRLPPGEWTTITGVNQDETLAKIKTSQEGVLHLHTPTPWAADPVLSEEHRLALLDSAVVAAAALSLERIDLEWAFTADGTLHLVQARPLTRPLHEARATGRHCEDGWTGIPAVAGTAAGPAVRIGEGTALTGAVLICGALGPEAAGALLEQPAAVVSTTGGPLSHTAIIARELGIPCVTNVKAATAIPSARLIEVNGTEGTVRPVAGIPEQRTERARLDGAAVVLQRLPATAAHDGRAATLLLHSPAEHHPVLPTLTASAEHGTVGVLIVDEDVATPELPGFQVIRLKSLGRLLWPVDGGDVPETLVTVDPNGRVLHSRGLHD
ncbi:PEP/pyruvate-binding domain-containing protein [Streptomyces sp. NPDC015232]|uniref:PEP/pyruvate-binding domain-containing protein n=1 Tax=Streptomyces TaxID=1883 RepID=UPI0004C90861|nr:PEP/pyruvate-binding domain-containing protein [Streptomyces anulatus]